MKTSKKIAIKAAGICIAVGILISFGALFAMGFDFTKLNTFHPVTNTYEVDEAFTDLVIEEEACSVRLFPSTDGSCKVVCRQSDKMTHRVVVEGQTMVIESVSRRKWYDHIGVFWGEMEVAVYLPQAAYGALRVSSVSGDIEVPDCFSFAEAQIDSTSGDVSFSAPVTKDLSIKTVSGDLYVGGITPKSLQAESTSGEITVSSVQLAEDLEASTTSGDIELTGVACQNVTVESTSGEVDLQDTVAGGKVQVETVSGDVELLRCDGAALWLKTSSGEVSGTLLTEKVFVTDTVSGDVDVPRTTSGGTCEITTTSGDIAVSIVP